MWYTCLYSPYLAWREEKRKMWECGVPCPELWGGVMLVGEREEGRFPGTAKDPTSSLPQDPWDLTHGQAGGAGVGKCRVCVGGGHVRRA